MTGWGCYTYCATCESDLSGRGKLKARQKGGGWGCGCGVVCFGYVGVCVRWYVYIYDLSFKVVLLVCVYMYTKVSNYTLHFWGLLGKNLRTQFFVCLDVTGNTTYLLH